MTPWTDTHGWTYTSRPEHTSDFDYRWTLQHTFGDWVLQWYDDATCTWKTQRTFGLEAALIDYVREHRS